MPEAEVDVDTDLVGALLREQHPGLAGLPRRVLASGWDNVLVRIGTGLLARLPRRAAAARLVEHEQTWLPVLAPQLPLPVPVPVAAGEPGCGYPWRWSLVPFLPGRPAEPRDLGTAAGAQLGRFLAALHRAAHPDAPENPYRGVPLAVREPSFRENLALAGEAVAGRADVDASAPAAPGRSAAAFHEAAMSVWSSAVAADQWAGPPRWLHGDVHPANILVEAGAISAVVDFGDLTAGDPATDLAVGWMLADAEARHAMWQAYRSEAEHDVDEALRQRAAGWALFLGLAMVAHSADNPTIRRIGRHTLAAALTP